MGYGYASETSVPVEKSKMEIDALLSKHGALSRGIIVDDEKGTAAIGFVRSGLKYRLSLPLPTPESVAREKKPTQWSRWNQEQRESWRRRRWEQACRSRWRAILLLLKAKFEAVRMGVTDVEKEFIGDLVLPGGETVLVALSKEIHEALSTGKMPTLMLPEART